MGTYWSNSILNFNFFADRKDFIQKGKEADKFVADNISDYYNYTRKSDFTALEQYENDLVFDKQNELQETLNSFDNIFASIDMGGAFKKSRLKITDDKRGIFDFGIASKGLYRRQEYFSEELAKDEPNKFSSAEYNFKPSGIVPSDFVEETFIGEEKFYWYTSDTGKKYLLTKQQEGTRAVELKLPGAKLVYATKTKKSYVMFEKKGGKAKMVELFIPVNKGITLTTALPLFLAAKFFQIYGVMTRINVIRMYSEQPDYVAWAYPVKDYGEEMDFNFIALNAVGGNWWEAIKSVVIAINSKIQIEKKLEAQPKGTKLTTGDFSIYDGQGGLPPTAKSYVELFSRYRNWYLEEIQKGKIAPIRVDKKLLISAVDETLYKQRYYDYDEILKVFFRIIDTVDFQFNKAESCCQRIYKRLVTDKLDAFYLTDEVKSAVKGQKEIMMNNMKTTLTAEFKVYVQNILFDTYDYPEDGPYAEPAESAEELEKELDEKLNDLNQFLKSL